MTTPTYDVAILGAGPGGSTAARLLAGKRSVLLIDPKTDDPESFQKPCGGLLSPDAQRSLARFALTLPKDALVNPQIFSVKTFDLASGLIRHYQRFYLNLDRHRFDRWLMELIPSEVVRYQGRAIVILPEQDGFLLTCRNQKGEEQRFFSHALIGADGAGSLVRRTLFPQHPIRRYVAIQQWFEASDQQPFYSCIFDPETSDCCSWTISKDQYLIFGGAFAPKNCRAQFEAQKQRLTERFGLSFGNPVKTEACQVLRPQHLGDLCSGKGRALLIGEAAGFISPSSLEGISWAIDTAQLAVKALLSVEPDRAATSYARSLRSLRLKMLAKIFKTPFLYHPLLRRWIMRSNLDAIEVSPKG